MMKYLFLSLLFLFSSSLYAARPSLKEASHWICFYGSRLDADLLKSLDLAILDPDYFKFPPNFLEERKDKPVLVGYVSVGEVEIYRWYWNQVKGQHFIAGENENWEGNFYADIRDPKWQSILLDEVIPDILSKGYDGLFLDTLDTAEYLEWKDPKKFKGSLEAMEKFIKTMREKFPDIVLVSNNAFPLLLKWGPLVDGALVEDLHTRYNFKEKIYQKTPLDISKKREDVLVELKKTHDVPVFPIVYAQNKQKNLKNFGVLKARAKGFFPYVTTLDLKHVGIIGPGTLQRGGQKK